MLIVSCQEIWVPTLVELGLVYFDESKFNFKCFFSKPRLYSADDRDRFIVSEDGFNCAIPRVDLVEGGLVEDIDTPLLLLELGTRSAMFRVVIPGSEDSIETDAQIDLSELLARVLVALPFDQGSDSGDACHRQRGLCLVGQLDCSQCRRSRSYSASASSSRDHAFVWIVPMTACFDFTSRWRVSPPACGAPVHSRPHRETQRTNSITKIDNVIEYKFQEN
jgi:hypothetical protein